MNDAADNTNTPILDLVAPYSDELPMLTARDLVTKDILILAGAIVLTFLLIVFGPDYPFVVFVASKIGVVVRFVGVFLSFGHLTVASRCSTSAPSWNSFLPLRFTN